MKRKTPPVPDSVVPPEILERATAELPPLVLKPPVKCVVCGSEGAPISSEQLCWVCRRLKISAWRESDAQIPVQE
jgi:hypothetical protein